MAVSATKTLLSLDRFAAVAGIHPLHFNQVSVADIAPGSTCDVPIMQYAWQHAGRIGREDIAEAIAQAEDIISSYLGFLPSVDWTVEEPQLSIRPNDPAWFSAVGLGVRAQYASLRAGKGYVWMGGQKAKSLIDNDVVIVYTDSDGDGYAETATVTVATTVTDPQEIGVFYPNQSGADQWEVRPLKSVTISGGNATIVMRREQLVLASLLEKLNPGGVDGLVNGNFLTVVDVYRVYNDPSQQVQLIWDSVGSVLCGCSGDEDCASCGYAVANGCLVVRENRVGIVSPQPGTWNADTESFDAAVWSQCRAPDRLRLWYRSGWKNAGLTMPYRQMDPLWERAITYFAMSLLERPLCACEPLESAFMHWREDLSHSQTQAGKSSSFQVSRKMLDNPFGMSRGAIYAWNLVSKWVIGNS